MNLRFTKMQGAGNDFIVLDATELPLALTPAQLRALGDRRFGIGADQILMVERSTAPGIDFRYRIFNGASGEEVEHCGNGARCFMRFVRDRGLTTRRSLRVETMNNLIELHLQDDDRVGVDMNAPIFELARLPFDASGLMPTREVDGFALWPLAIGADAGGARTLAGSSVGGSSVAGSSVAGSSVGSAAVGSAAVGSAAVGSAAVGSAAGGGEASVEWALLSMGNPHAVRIVADVDAAPVAVQGPLIESHPRFARRVNVGFLQVIDRSHVRLRVHERGAGETLCCGTGACAAVVAGIRLGLLDPGRGIEVETRGGRLTIAWPGGDGHVTMTGPAETVFEGSVQLPA